MPAPQPILLPRLRLPLRTPRLLLRLPRASDAPSIAAWFADRRVTRPIPLWPAYSVEDARRFVGAALGRARRRDALQLASTLRSDGRLIGGVALGEFSPAKREGHLGYWVGRAHWGHGYAPAAASRLCELAFRTMHLHRLQTGVFPFNPRSIAVLRRLGFVEEGRERRSYRVDGRWVDSIRFGLLADEFRPYRPTGPA